MANWSETQIVFNGGDIKGFIKEAKKYLLLCDLDSNSCYIKRIIGLDLSGYSSKSGSYGYSYFSISEIIYDSEHICILGSGRWAAPYNFIKEMVAKYGLSGYYNDAECGCDFYHSMEFINGEITEEIEDDYLCAESFKAFGLDYWLTHIEYIDIDKDNWEEERDVQKLLEYGVDLEDIIDYLKA